MNSSSFSALMTLMRPKHTTAVPPFHDFNSSASNKTFQFSPAAAKCSESFIDSIKMNAAAAAGEQRGHETDSEQGINESSSSFGEWR